MRKRSVYEPTTKALFEHAIDSWRRELCYDNEMGKRGVQYHIGLAHGILLMAKAVLGDNNPLVCQMQATWDEMTQPTAQSQAQEVAANNPYDIMDPRD